MLKCEAYHISFTIIFRSTRIEYSNRLATGPLSYKNDMHAHVLHLKAKHIMANKESIVYLQIKWLAWQIVLARVPKTM